MTGRTERADALVIAFRLPAQLTGHQRRQIKAMFPAWTVRHNPVRDSWNAYRDGEPPYFGPAAANERTHMVSACDVPSLVALLEQQVHTDIGIEFPGWRVRADVRAGGTPSRLMRRLATAVRFGWCTLRSCQGCWPACEYWPGGTAKQPRRP